MSIKNRYDLTQQVLSSYYLMQRKSWNLVLFRFEDEVVSHLEYFLSALSINFLTRDFTIDHIYIYHYDTQKNITAYQEIIEKYNVRIIRLPFSLPRNNIRLVIMKKFLTEQKNTIFLGKSRVYLNTQNELPFEIIHNDQLFLSAMVPNANLNDPLNKTIIDSDFLIVLPTKQNLKIINYALSISKQLDEDDYLSTNISLSITNQKFNSIQLIPSINNVTLSIYDKTHLAVIREIYAYNRGIFHNSLLPLSMKDVDYLLHNYIYYPYFDIDTPVEWLSNLENITNNSINEYTNHPLTFNTNGFQHSLTDFNIIYSKLYTRFNDKMSGLFIKKKSQSGIINQIIHHFWLNESPVDKYIDAWGQILTDPWKYFIWTKEKIETEVLPNSRWDIPYQYSNVKIKNIICFIVVLELYGGIAIDSSLLPIRQIPSELLNNNFFIGFINEKTHGRKLSFKIIGSGIGTSKKNPSIKKTGKVIHPKNYVFNATFTNQNQVMVQDNNVFDEIYQTLVNKNHLDALENVLIANHNITVYPSYYFNPNLYFHPEQVMDMALCVRIHKTRDRKISQKSGIKRSYPITTQSILSKLEENPRDKIKNVKTMRKIDINND